MPSFLDDLRDQCPNWEFVQPISREYVHECIAWHHPTAFWDPEMEEPIELQPEDVELTEHLAVSDIQSYSMIQAARDVYSDTDTPDVWHELFLMLKNYEELQPQFVEITGTLDHCARFKFGLVRMVRKDKKAMVRPLYLRPVDCIWTTSWDLTSGPCW